METLPGNDAAASFLRQSLQLARHRALFSRRHGLPFVDDRLQAKVPNVMENILQNSRPHSITGFSHAEYGHRTGIRNARR